MSYFRERSAIDRARRQRMQELMEDYDKNVYRPALKELYEKCDADGGHQFLFNDTGLFPWIEFWRCSRCGKGKTVNLKEEGE